MTEDEMNAIIDERQRCLDIIEYWMNDPDMPHGWKTMLSLIYVRIFNDKSATYEGRGPGLHHADLAEVMEGFSLAGDD